MSRKRQSITLSIQDHDKAELEALALAFGMTWGDRPNVSRLVEAIARGNLRLAVNHDWSAERVNALNAARNRLTDLGDIELALAIARLMLERNELSLPLRHEIKTFVAQPIKPWRQALDGFLQRQQPFQFAYQDAAEQVWRFTIRHAEVVRHEDREYLDCWCEEASTSDELPALAHNWSLRIDRIADEVAIAPVAGEWRSQPDFIPVELHLSGGLAFGYRTKTDADTINEWHPELPQVRRVVRRVTHSFWFFREILRYGELCEIIAPDEMRDRFKQRIQNLCQKYGL